MPSYDGLPNSTELFRATLFESMPDACTTCIDARMLVGKVVQVVGMEEFMVGSGGEDFTSFMAGCTEGPQMVGKCGTMRRVCSHPHLDAIPDKAQDYLQ
jgi:hypothetical protein